MKIAGAVVLVTGANRGIGRTFTEALLARGAAKVYAGARDVSTIDDPRVVPVALDVTDADQVAAVAAQLGDVTLLINNAGIASVANPLQAELDVARRELEVNYLGTVATTQAFAPVLAANGGGAVVNILSVVSFVAPPHFATYAASKAAAWAWTNAARIQLRQQGTDVVGVHVGYVDTDLTAGLDVEKIKPDVVVEVVLDALEAGKEEVLVDDFTRLVKSALHDDLALLYPEIERQFLAAQG